MKWFKFNWFGSKERADLHVGSSGYSGTSDYMSDAGNLGIAVLPGYSVQPFKNLYFSGDIITVVLNDGTLISKKGDKATFDKVRVATTEKEITDLLTEQVLVKDKSVEDRKETLEERELVLRNIDILTYNPEFEIKGNNVFLKGVNLPLPAVVTATFIEICEKIDKADIPSIACSEELASLMEEYEALEMFWIKLALNGLEKSREDLLRFVKENDVRITTNGNLVLYRRIVSKGDKNKDLITFISQEYYKIKKWKKSPKNYDVFSQENGGYILVHENDYSKKNLLENQGVLYDLYVNLPNMEANTYTASHDKSVDIKVGALYSINEKKINLNNGLCAAGGLHAAAVDYDYSGFGDTKVVVLVNPSKAITVPLNEIGKLRTTEMFIACVNDKDQGVHFDENSLSAFDEEYNNLTIKELEDAIRDKSFKIASVEDNVSPISFTDLESIKDMLSKRVKRVQF